MKHTMYGLLVALLVTGAEGQQPAQKDSPIASSSQRADKKTAMGAQGRATEMQKIYMDESHCLTSADMRGDTDKPISCYCRDAIADARYVYFTYFLSGKDWNLKGVFLHLQDRAGEMCSRDTAERLDEAFMSNIDEATTSKDWKWSGPEVVRTYPPDDAIKRIKPNGTTRWVPFTIRLVYRDTQGRVTRTEDYSSREPFPVFPEKP